MSVYVSQDGYAEAVHKVATGYGDGTLRPPHTQHFEHWQRERIPLLSAKQVSPACSIICHLLLLQYVVVSIPVAARFFRLRCSCKRNKGDKVNASTGLSGAIS